MPRLLIYHYFVQGFPTTARSQGASTRKVISATEIEGASGTVYSDSSASNASYPLTLSAQRQRKLSSCNLKKSRFGNPYFGFLASSPDSKHVRSLDPSRHLGATSPVNSQSPRNLIDCSNPLKINLVNSSKTKELMLETDKTKPVFVISEEGDDQQPLVLAEHLSQCGDHLSEQNAVYAPAVPDKQPMVLTTEGNNPASLMSNLPLWAKSPSLYKGHVKIPSSSREQQSSSAEDANTTETSQNCDTIAAPTLSQASVQWCSQKDWNISSQKQRQQGHDESGSCAKQLSMAVTDGCNFVKNSVCFPSAGTEITRMHTIAQHKFNLFVCSLTSSLFFCMEFWCGLYKKVPSEKVLQTLENLFWNEKWKSSEMVTPWFMFEMSISPLSLWYHSNLSVGSSELNFVYSYACTIQALPSQG